MQNKIYKIENIQSLVPENVWELWQELESAGFITYLVGGAVRDLLLGKTPKDYDLATEARPVDIDYVLSVSKPDINISYVGAEFGVIIADGIEIATFRADGYRGQGDVLYADNIHEDLARRDLTINAIAIGSLDDIADPFNGIKDLQEGLIRFVGDPNERITGDQDGLIRIIRACRFIAKYGFAPTASTAKAIWENRERVLDIAPEKIRLELLKAMELEYPSIFFGAMQFLGVLELIIPELAECYGHDGGKHHPETVWEHVMLVGDYLPASDPILRLAGFLHDIGKPAAWKEQEGKFINHHIIGRDILNVILPKLKFSKAETSRIAGLTACHMFYISDISPKAQRKLIRNLDSFGVDWKDLVRLRIADARGNIARDPHSITDIKSIINSFTQVEDTPITTKSLAVSGGQLIEEFCLPRGPIVSEIQRALLEFSTETGIVEEDCLLIEAYRILKR